ncbi:MAG: asparagine--tRNA ligase [Spirochaetales bacterium]|nr:asparagine--tRNA ligase [Spirochaetales bacterium]
MKKQSIADILQLKGEKQELTAYGWVRTSRDSKAFGFVEMNDGSVMSNLQVFVDKEVSAFKDIMPKLTTGTSLRVRGVLVESPGGKQNVELKASEIEILGSAPAEDYPLQKKRHSLEFLREIAHLRPRTNTFGAVTRVRNALSFAVHRFFQEQGFLYINTPIITGSDCEGAGEMFQVTTLPLDNVPKSDGKVDYSQDFFGKQTSLTVSGQLNGEIFACALGNIYTFGPTFRAEHSNTSRHLAEFWMIEPEMAFCDINGNMDTAEAFLKYIINYTLKHCAEDMDFFNKWVDKGRVDMLEKIVNSTFTRTSYTEAISILEKAPRDFEYPVKWGIDLQSEHEKYLTEEVFNGPVILSDYPRDIKAFYMKQNDDHKTVRAMDVLVPRIGEIIGGSERENDLHKLKARIKELGLREEDYWWYLELRKYGSVPHSGFGLGFERMVQFVTGMQNIRDVIPFPRAYQSADF